MKIGHWLLGALGCCFASGTLVAAPAYSPRVGEIHPDFTLPKIDDRSPVSLPQFRGNKVLLIHFSSW